MILLALTVKTETCGEEGKDGPISLTAVIFSSYLANGVSPLILYLYIHNESVNTSHHYTTTHSYLTVLSSPLASTARLTEPTQPASVFVF